MSQFTPGPWTIEGPDFVGDYNILHPANSLAVAGVTSDKTIVVTNLREPREVAANARLIAASPELYKECRLFVERVERGEIRSTETYERMKAVLAKADGK